MHRVLTIAGSDSGGGAGIQADLKTFSAFGVYGTSAITALTAQNTLGVQGIYPVSPEFIVQQLESILGDIGTDAAKTGMLATEDVIDAVVVCLGKYSVRRLVVDPVMVAKSGDPLLEESAREALRRRLIPLAEIITPNLLEAEALCGEKITNLDGLERAAAALTKLGCQWVVVKGGARLKGVDVVHDGRRLHRLEAVYHDTVHTHGSGCTFSAAIAAARAKGLEPLEAIRRAKSYISEAIRAGGGVGRGRGPAQHLAGLESPW